MGRWLGLQGDEGAKAARLVALVFLASAALVLVKAAQSGLFLERFGAETIPWAFAASALLLAALSSISVSVAPRLGQAPLAMATLALVALLFVGLRVMLFFDADWSRFLLYVVIEAGSGVLLIQVWSIAGSATDARSARRLLPVAGLGASVAWGLGGFLVDPLTASWGAESTLLVAPVLLVLAMIPLHRIRALDLEVERGRVRQSLSTSWRQGFRTVARSPLMRVVAALSVLALVTEQTMDLLLMATARETLVDAEAIGAFFGRYYGATSLVGMALLAGLSGRLLGALGAPRSLALMPVVIVVLSLVALIAPGLAAAVVLRGSARVMKQGVWSSSVEQLQTPLSGVGRTQARAAIRGVLAPAAYGLTALGLTLLPPSVDLRVYTALTLVTSAGMALLVIRRARRVYRAALHRAVDARRLLLGPSRSPASPDLDADACEALGEELVGGDVARAALAAEVLGLCGSRAASKSLVRGLQHQEPEIRRVAARAMRLAQSDEARAALEASVHEDADPGVRAEALEALLQYLGPSEAMLDGAARDTHRRIAIRAEIALLTRRHRGEALGAALLPYLEDTPELPWALDALDGDASAARGIQDALRALLREASVDSRLSAARAVIRLGLVALLPAVVELLKDPRTAPATAHALVRLGRGIRAPEVGERTLAASLSRLADRVATEEAPQETTEALVLRLLDHGDPDVRRHATEALGASIARKERPPMGASFVAPLLERDLQRAYKLYSVLAGLAHDDGVPDWEVEPAFASLAHEVELRIERARRDVLGRLMLRGRERLVSAVEVARRRPSAPRDARVAELLELELEPGIARGVVPLFERVSLRQRFETAARLRYVDRGARHDPLDAIVALGDPHLEAAAHVAYGARFVERFPERAATLAPMIPLYERIRFLRSVPLFADLPGEEVVQLAEKVEQVERLAGSVVFREGDAGDELYVVVRGAVEMRRGGALLATMRSSEFFGELALLDHQARSADAVVVEDSQLLRLRGADLEELMVRRPAATREIVRVLVTRLRATLP